MSSSPGQNSGQAPGPADSGASPGYSWADYVADLVETEGTLTAVAQKLLARVSDTDDIGSIERALRRLRERGQRDGGIWGQRVLRVFGVPRSVDARVRWMGLYHSPFSDLPVALCSDLLRVWDRPPVSESRSRVYLQLGLANCALRRRSFEQGASHLDAARAALAGDASSDGAALVELSLARAYLASGASPDRVPELLDEAERALGQASLEPPDRACFEARLVDQRAFADNHERTSEGYVRALQRYRALSTTDVHPFASYRREAGLAFGHHALGDSERALVHVRRALQHAGDGGLVRFRVMGLILKARILGARGRASLERAEAIATRLEDVELSARVQRALERMR